jgi:hypothetical protein
MLFQIYSKGAKSHLKIIKKVVEKYPLFPILLLASNFLVLAKHLATFSMI